jgi:protein-tyrosine-phosphatase
MLRRADLVLVMSPSHRAAVLAMGASVERVHVVNEWPPPGEPGLAVFDPFGASYEAYEECWRRLQQHARRIAPHVRYALRERRP